MNLFLKKIAYFSLYLSLIIFTLTFILLKNNPHIYQQLYFYQLNKLKNHESYSTLFIGDSSLGNAIDSNEFSDLSSQMSVNCALTGLFGYAGSYNMLKIAHRYNPNLKNVIVMQTLDIQTRKIAMDGYVRSCTSISDFIETNNKLDFVKKSIQYIRSIPLSFWIKKDKLLVNDYIKQKGFYKPDSIQVPLSVDKINPNKSMYLVEINKYCLQQKLNMIYIHGPLYKGKIDVSSNYIKETNRILNNNMINVIRQIIPIKRSQLGNTDDHVNPKFKKEFTKLYYDILKEHLVK